MSKSNMKFTRAVCWINLEINNWEAALHLWYSHVITIVDHYLCCHNCGTLLFCNYWRPLMLWNSSSWSLIVQIQLVLYPCDSFFINNHNMTSNSVENHCFVVFNIKLEVEISFKMFYWFLELPPTNFSLIATGNTACFASHFCLS